MPRAVAHRALHGFGDADAARLGERLMRAATLMLWP